MIYLDSSALVKLVHVEEHTDELRGWLAVEMPALLVASVLAEVEVSRAVRRHAPDRLEHIPTVLDSLDLVKITGSVRAKAAGYPDPLLRSLDALHLATAHSIASTAGAAVTALVTYDERLAKAASEVGLPVVMPGVEAQEDSPDR